MRLYKSTRLCLENKSKEFEKVGWYSHEKEYNNSAVSRYYYSMFIRVSYIYKGIVGNMNTNKDSHQSVIKLLKNQILVFIIKKYAPNSEMEKATKEVFVRLELCCRYRNIADYKEGELTINNVNYLKKTLLMFNDIYEDILEICGILKKEKGDLL